MKSSCLIAVVISLIFIPAVLFGDSGAFDVAGVQFEISPQSYESEDSFYGEVEAVIERLCSENEGLDLIVFPEYIGVFYQLIRYNHIISGHNSFQSALTEVLESNPGFDTMSDVFRSSSEDVESYISFWSGMAEEYGVAVIAGSCFATGGGGRLYNRSYVFGRDGRQIYHQDKVFLTDFESSIVGLTAGEIEDASFFRVSGKKLAMTICRDAYAREWEQKNSGAFLWVDIKANGETFNTAQRQSFLRALPARLFYSDVNYGMTVCAVGHYLDLFWEGESTAIRKDGENLYLVSASGSCDEAGIILFNIPRGR